MFSTYRKYLNGWHICGNLLEFVDQQLEKWNNKTNRLYIMLKHVFIKSNILHRKLYIIERNVYNENIKDKQKENKIYKNI